MRIGHGVDIHKFTTGEAVILGGVTIPHTQAIAAHSDGDVLIHAICDALLGAGALGDIGQHFPDTDISLANVDSRVLLKGTVDLLAKAGWQVVNVDSTIIAQAPKLAPFIPTMRQLLATDLAIAYDAINIKATTTEKLGFIGCEKGIAAHAVALIAQA